MAERLNALVIRANSPDGRIEGVYSFADGPGIRFRDDSYRGYTERTLERQLARLATVLWTRYQRGYDDTVEAVTGHPPRRNSEPWDADRRRFREEQAATVARGMSSGGVVFFENTGMLNWQVVIRDGTLAGMDESAFVAEVLSGYHAMSQDYRHQMARLRAKHYGPVIGAVG